ncbi:putative HTH type 3 domain protein [Desulfosarcina variabilis str. Montpellier]|uniref:helix-turn-helix domain-containing protein n=1 Tax=Desulfosarcina variabilis TaxID=2300 RepID=UPI003AFA1F21
MKYILEHLTKSLQAARKAKGMSQRALSRRTGMPQAQISKIENAAVDLKTSSLVSLARALELEVMLIPRTHIPAVNGLLRMVKQTDDDESTAKPLYALDDTDNDE